MKKPELKTLQYLNWFKVEKYLKEYCEGFVRDDWWNYMCEQDLRNWSYCSISLDSAHHHKKESVVKTAEFLCREFDLNPEGSVVFWVCW